MGIHYYKHMKPLLPSKSFVPKCMTCIPANIVKDVEWTADERITDQQQYLASSCPSNLCSQLVFTLYLKIGKIHEKLSTIGNVGFIFIILRYLSHFFSTLLADNVVNRLYDFWWETHIIMWRSRRGLIHWIHFFFSTLGPFPVLSVFQIYFFLFFFSFNTEKEEICK